MIITNNHFISVKPPEHPPVMNTFVTITVGFITIGATVNATNNRTTMNTFQLAALCGAKHFISYLTDAGHSHFLVDGMSEGTSADLNSINDAGSIPLIIELKAFRDKRTSVFIELASKGP
jgi:hypothetical protein